MKNNIIKKVYIKPEIHSITIDNLISMELMSEGTIPDSPPWDGSNKLSNPKDDPYKSQTA